MQSKIEIDLDEVDRFVERGGQLVFVKESEEAILKLLELQEIIEKKIEEVKLKIAETGQRVHPNFKGVIGDRLKATFRLFGEKYVVDESMLEKAAPFTFEKKSLKVDTKKVEEFIKKYGYTPDGVLVRLRMAKISLNPIKKDENTTSS